MKKKPDLTRWNHAGLDRFCYVNGNAATFLEHLRCLLAEPFPEWDNHLRTLLSLESPGIDAAPPVSSEPAIQASARITAQYNAGRRDWTWEILRTFARACHVLTGHIDAYANEAYLGTATQWDNLRRLVKMLDCHPRPPASASTLLLLQAKADKRGVVEQGFQVKNAPKDGSAPVTFETLENIYIDSALNEIRLEGWNHSPSPLIADPKTEWLWVKETGEAIGDLKISAGQPALMLNIADPDKTVSVRISRVDLAKGRIELNDTRLPVIGQWPKGDTRLLALPREVHRFRLNGAGVIRFQKAHGLSPGHVIAWQKENARQTEKTWHCERIIESDALSLRLPKVQPLPVMEKSVYGTYSLSRPRDGSEFSFTASVIAVFWLKGSQFLKIEAEKDLKLTQDGRYNRVLNPDIEEIFIVSAAAQPVGNVAAVEPREFVLDGKPRDLKTGVCVVGEGRDMQDHPVSIPLIIDSIEEREAGFAVTFDRKVDSILDRLIGPFRYTFYPHGFNLNQTPLVGNHVFLEQENEAAVLAVLKPGRRILLERIHGDGTSILATTITAIATTEVDTKTKVKKIVIGLADALDGLGFTTGTTVIRGNMVRAGHGERRPEKILGSGAAALSYQTFIFDTPEVSFIADPVLASGLRADIAIKVEGQRWQQVSSLRESGPADTHYTVRMTEKGYLQIGFGDGFNGRRLPTGTDNVRVAYRVGAGMRGNVLAGSLQTLARPHVLVEKARQPLAATGGSDLEDKQSLRESAPASISTIERAVTLEDFADLARSHSSVWDACARYQPMTGDRCQHVVVTVVPAGGGELHGLGADLCNFLQVHALPYVRLKVDRYEDRYVSLTIGLAIDTAVYDPDIIKEDVRAALFEVFSLRKRKLGQALYIGEVYRVVERIRGVSNSVCTFKENEPGDLEMLRGADGVARIVRPGARHVLYLHRDRSTLEVSYGRDTI